MPARSSSSSSPGEDELLLPRPPGVLRRFWARHPLLADVLIAAVCLLFSLTPVANVRAPSQPGWAVTATPPEIVLSGLMTASVIATCVLLLVRRRWPFASFAGSVVVALAFLLAANPVGGPLLLVTTYSVAVYRSAKAAWIGLGAAVGIIAITAFGLTATGTIVFPIAINAVIVEGVIGLIGALVGVNVGNRMRYVEAIIDRSRQLLVERDQQARLAAAAERTRIAREMHDIVSHNLTVIVALSEGANATSDRERSRAAVAQVSATARGALAEMRAMLGVLRDPHASDAAPLAPQAASEPLDAVSAAQRAGFPVAFTTSGAPDDVPAPVRFAVSRVVQESLTNAMRHAPHASLIDVRLHYGGDAVTVVVDNDAVADDRPAGGGYGLPGLSERVEHLGGEIAAGPGAPRHWRVRARLPVGDVPADPPSGGSL